MRTKIERVDMARLAIMYLHGGVYADLDQELLSAALLRCVVTLDRIVLPTTLPYGEPRSNVASSGCCAGCPVVAFFLRLGGISCGQRKSRA